MILSTGRLRLLAHPQGCRVSSVVPNPSTGSTIQRLKFADVFASNA
jgi:hypothetical protein